MRITSSSPAFLFLTVIVSLGSYHAGYRACKLEQSMQRSLTLVSEMEQHVPLMDETMQVVQHAAKTAESDMEKGYAVKVASPAAVENTIGDSCSKYVTKGEEIFYETAKALSPITDKVTIHTYQIMYGRFLLPYYDQNPAMKFLEIGLGCNMNYGPGASVAVWKKLFPKADLWEAEYNATCVEKHKDVLKGINILTGNQGNNTVLDSWIETSGGNFDVVIDDGGHNNCQILHSFEKLWPTVKPGGLYFIEDLQVGRKIEYKRFKTDTCKKSFIMMDRLKEYADILIDVGRKKEFLASDIEFIFCQHESCVLGKKKK